MMLATTGGSTESHFSALATSSMLASTPSAAHSCRAGPLICAAAGALPEITRDFRTVMAESPPPPATAKSFHVWPSASIIFLSSPAALASPPDVHQCRTSSSSAWTAFAPRMAATAMTVRRRALDFLDMCLSPYRYSWKCNGAPRPGAVAAGITRGSEPDLDLGAVGHAVGLVGRQAVGHVRGSRLVEVGVGHVQAQFRALPEVRAGRQGRADGDLGQVLRRAAAGLAVGVADLGQELQVLGEAPRAAAADGPVVRRRRRRQHRHRGRRIGRLVV